ncbi:MAG: hypothetical protein K0S44_2529 [Bacteroidetes bacterium]|jgi:hypothetical protein|nr:hypothetical protein [Bacteroidota bacterium]
MAFWNVSTGLSIPYLLTLRLKIKVVCLTFCPENQPFSNKMISTTDFTLMLFSPFLKDIQTE